MKQKKEFHKHVFSNGFTLLWKQTNTQTIFANLSVNHGALDEKKGEEGIAHMLEHMILEGGTRKYTPEEQAEIRGQFGYSNAFTSRDKTIFPWGMNASDLLLFLDLMSEMVFFPRFDEKIIEQQKKIIQREIAHIKGVATFDDFSKFYFPKLTRHKDHTYFTAGKEKIILAMTQTKLFSFHNRGYLPQNMSLMLSGNIPRNIVSLVERYFGKVKRSKRKTYTFSTVTPLKKREVRYSYAPDLLNKDNPMQSNAYIALGLAVAHEFQKDAAELLVLSEILGGSWTSGLKKKMRSIKGMSYQITASYTGKKNFGYFCISGKVDALRIEEALDVMFNVLRELQQAPLDQEEVNRAKKRVIYRYSQTLESPFIDFLQRDPINVSNIAQMNYFVNERISQEKMRANISKVTPSSIKTAAQKFFPENRKKGKYVLLVRDPLLQKK